MKKINLLVAIATVCVCFLSGCNASKNVTAQSGTRNANPFGPTFTLPCAVYDTKTEFAATGIYRGSS